jgi:hypothetical protein
MFQATRSDKEVTRKLVHAVNYALSETVPKENLNDLFDAMWKRLETTLASLPQPEETVPTKRPIEEMVAEILEIVRAERSNPARTAPPDASTLDHRLRAIRDLLLDQSKFLSSCLNPLAGFRFEDDDVYFIYPLGCWLGSRSHEGA